MPLYHHTLLPFHSCILLLSHPPALLHFYPSVLSPSCSYNFLPLCPWMAQTLASAWGPWPWTASKDCSHALCLRALNWIWGHGHLMPKNPVVTPLVVTLCPHPCTLIPGCPSAWTPWCPSTQVWGLVHKHEALCLSMRPYANSHALAPSRPGRHLIKLPLTDIFQITTSLPKLNVLLVVETKRDLAEQIRGLEERILYLESLSPEYFSKSVSSYFLNIATGKVIKRITDFFCFTDNCCLILLRIIQRQTTQFRVIAVLQVPSTRFVWTSLDFLFWHEGVVFCYIFVQWSMFSEYDSKFATFSCRNQVLQKSTKGSII